MGRVENILLTGRPGVGKSTLIKRIVDRLRDLGYTGIGGFYTLEVRRGCKRTGFRIHALDGREGRLAEAGLESRYRLGRYGIDMEEFERVAVGALEEAVERGYTVIIDEIGFMELKSRRFRELVEEAFDGPCPVVATVMRSRCRFADRLKAREDVKVIVVRVENRERLVDDVVDILLKGGMT